MTRDRIVHLANVTGVFLAGVGFGRTNCGHLGWATTLCFVGVFALEVFAFFVRPIRPAPLKTPEPTSRREA